MNIINIKYEFLKYEFLSNQNTIGGLHGLARADEYISGTSGILPVAEIGSYCCTKWAWTPAVLLLGSLRLPKVLQLVDPLQAVEDKLMEKQVVLVHGKEGLTV